MTIWYKLFMIKILTKIFFIKIFNKGILPMWYLGWCCSKILLWFQQIQYYNISIILCIVIYCVFRGMHMISSFRTQKHTHLQCPTHSILEAEVFGLMPMSYFGDFNHITDYTIYAWHMTDSYQVVGYVTTEFLMHAESNHVRKQIVWHSTRMYLTPNVVYLW